MTAARRWRRCACGVAFVLLALLAAGCAGLPQDVKRSPSLAIPAAHDTELGRIAQASTPAAAAAASGAGAPSGFRLLSWSGQSLYARIELARRAQRSLDLQYYELRDDGTGRLLMRTLRDAAQRGVRVRLLLDDLYTAGSDPVLSGLAAFPNIEVRLFNPFPAGRASLGARLTASLFDFGRVNHRMHNKLFVADGVMAVAGGRNIANEYFMVSEEANYIDLDAFAIGPVVGQLEALFDQYWNSEFVYPLEAIVHDDDSPAERRQRFDEWTDAARAPPPAPPAPGERDLFDQPHVHEELASGRVQLTWAPCEAFADAPEKVINHTRRWLPGAQREEKTVRRGLMSELLLARQEVLVSSPYMVPNADVIEDIREGRLWGLQITLITNSLASTDEPLVHAGYRRYRREMLDLGVQLYEIVPSRVTQAKSLGPFGSSLGRFHAKAAAVDGKVVFIGSLNFDPRSEKHNTELGLLIRSPELAAQLKAMAELVQREGAYRVVLSKDKSRLEWHLPAAEGGPQVLTEEPDSTWWQRLWLNLIGPLVPEEAL